MNSIFKMMILFFVATFLLSCQQDVKVDAVATYTFSFEHSSLSANFSEYGVSEASQILVFYADNTFEDSIKWNYSFKSDSSSNRIYVNQNYVRSSGTWSGDFSTDGEITYVTKKVVDSKKVNEVFDRIHTTAYSADSETTISVTNSDIPLVDVEKQIESSAVLYDETKKLYFGGIYYTLK